MIVIHRFWQVANDPLLKRARPDSFIWVCRDENRRDSVARIYQVSVELDAGHSGHLDVGDQARRFSEMRRCEKIGCRRKRFDGIAQRGHELSHGFAKGLIILDNRYQRVFRHPASRYFPRPPDSAPHAPRLHALS